VKVREGTSPEVLAYVRNKATIFQSGIPPDCELFSDIINRDYQSEFKFQTMITTFSVLSVLIACLGLLGLVSFTTEIRQKEIGIRKVLGASSLHIGKTLVEELLLLILVSGIVAVPISLDLSQTWLSHFAYRAGLPVARMLLAVCAICTVSILVVIVQVYRAASKNPLETLKYE
jgi:putative ABC transport system permease protein